MDAALKRAYAALLDWAYAWRRVVLTGVVGILLITAAISTRVGSEFAPQLSEGDFALQLMRAPKTGIEESLKIQAQVEQQLLKQFPEIKAIFARTGTAEVATDVMPPNISDAVILLKPRKEWPDSTETIDELRARMLDAVAQLPGNNSEFSHRITF